MTTHNRKPIVIIPTETVRIIAKGVRKRIEAKYGFRSGYLKQFKPQLIALVKVHLNGGSEEEFKDSISVFADVHLGGVNEKFKYSINVIVKTMCAEIKAVAAEAARATVLNDFFRGKDPVR